MGWTSLNKPKGIKVIDFLEREIYSKEEKFNVIYKCTMNKAIFFALENKDTKEVTADIVAYSFRPKTTDYFNLDYKIMSENCMPYYFCTNNKFLKLLSPTTNKMAIEWRENCKKLIEKKKELSNISSGDIIELNDKSFYVVNGTEIKYLKVVNLKKNIAKPMKKLEDNNFKPIENSIYNFIGFNRKIKRVM